MNMIAAFDELIVLWELRASRGKNDHTIPDDALTLDHVKSMRSRMLDSFSEGKSGRWLGWAQAAFVANGLGTLEDMKLLNMRHSTPD